MKWIKAPRLFFRLVASLLMLITLDSYALTAQEIYEKVKNSIYTLYSIDFKTKSVKARGGAVAVTKTRLATNCHVALAGNYLVVKVDGKARLALLFYEDTKQDLCLLEIPNANFTPVPIRDSNSVKIGEAVYAIGNPQGTEKSLSQGIISNRLSVDGGTWLQTDAAIYFGSSGGGLFDQNGDLIGITTKMGGNFGFAIPTEWILSVLKPKLNSRLVNMQKPAAAPSSTNTPMNSSVDYSRAHANLQLVGTYGHSEISLYRNNRECFISIPGHDANNKKTGLIIWNPRHPEKMVVFSSAASVETALELLLRSILEGKEKKQDNYRSDNVLQLGNATYSLYGVNNYNERYAYFVARFNASPLAELKKASEFTVQFHDTDPKIGNEKVTYQMDGFDQALQAFEKECGVEKSQ